MSDRLVFSSPRAEARLERAASWLSERTEARVLVVGASLEAASEVIRRAVARAEARAAIGWERTTLTVLATTLARPKLVEKSLAPASPLALEALAARVVHDEAKRLVRFAPISDRPGLPRALARTLTELRLAGIDEPGDAELGRLLAAYAKALTRAGLADRATMLELACRAAATANREARARKEPAPALLLVDVPLRTRAEAGLVAELAKSVPTALAVLPKGDHRALALAAHALDAVTTEAPPATTSAVDRLQHFLFTADETPPPAAIRDEELTFLSAPGESRECVEIARLITREAHAGTPLDRMAVLVRTPAYGAHLVEAFRRAAIPAHFARGTRRPDPTGRALLALLLCAEDGLSARRFAEYLSLGVVAREDEAGAPPAAAPRTERVATPDEEELRGLVGAAARELDEAPEHEDAPASAVRAPRHWEKLLVDAAVIGGADRWRRRLDGLARKLASDLAVYEADGEAGLAEACRRDANALAGLHRYALPLIRELEALPAEASWGEWVEALSRLATRAIDRPDRVVAVLAELEPMAKVGRVTLAEARVVLEQRLSQLQVAPPGRRYGKVFVATIEEARGLSFDVVFVPGLAEKMFPQKVVEDPLLLDAARRALDSGLPTNAERSDDERLALRLAAGAATRRLVFSYPRVDLDQARPRTPSFYGLEILRIAGGELRDFEHLAKTAARTADARIGWPAPQRRAMAIDEAEYDLALLDEALRLPEEQVVGHAHYLLSANEHLARALRFRGRRWLKSWKASDGLVDPPEEALVAIREHGTSVRSFSPTALQNFAACPYRFLLSAVHRLARREEVAPIEDIDPLTRGSLVHEVQYTLLTKLEEAGRLPVTEATLDDARDLLDDVMTEVSAEYQDRLNPAIPRVWEDAMAGIAADLREWLRRMTDATGRAWVPAHFELSFGLRDVRDQDEHSRKEPVDLGIGLLLRGSIDLVEKTADGRIRATDSKTGKVRAKKGQTVIGGGEILQPVLYALTLEKFFPEATVESGRLYYCTAAGGFEDVDVPLDARARESARVVAKTVGDALQSGFLPAAPNLDSKGYSACTYCDFRAVCGPYEEIRTKRKARGPLKPLIELRRLP